MMLYVPAAYVILFLYGLHFTDAAVYQVGIDVSKSVSTSSFKCLRNLGYDFLIVRAYRNIGVSDSMAAQTLANAKKAGFRDIDVYMFPCSHGNCKKSARQQVQEMVNALKGSYYRRIWLDIEGVKYWRKDKESNQEFFEELLKEARKHKPVGVYASPHQWNSIMGDSYSGGSSHKLWYPRYSCEQYYNDLPKPFGGWKQYYMRQYEPNVKICGTEVDINYRINHEEGGRLVILC